MSTKKIRTYNFDEIISRIMAAKDLQHEYQVAEILGFKRVAFSERKKRNSVPVEQLMLFCEEEKINPTWLLTGQGDTTLERPGAADQAAPGGGPKLSPEKQTLVKLVELMTDEEADEIVAQYIRRLRDPEQK